MREESSAGSGVPLALQRTPVVRLAHTSASLGREVWVKQDGATAAIYGGNKPRKLRPLFAEAHARGARTLLTVGAYGSHHVLATALHGRAQGFAVEAVLVPQPWHSHVEANVRLDLGAGATLWPVGGPLAAARAVMARRRALEAAGARPFVIAPGGSSPTGTLGFVDAGAELAAQVRAGEAPLPVEVICALGSGGTAAGLALGFAREGLRVRVRGVRVTDRWMMNRASLEVLAHRTASRLEARWPAARALARRALSLLDVDGAEFGEGYGRATEAGCAATERAAADGLVLDGTYTAKAFAAVVRGPRAAGPVVYWHTLNAVPLDERLRDAPSAPPWLMAARASP